MDKVYTNDIYMKEVYSEIRKSIPILKSIKDEYKINSDYKGDIDLMDD